MEQQKLHYTKQEERELQETLEEKTKSSREWARRDGAQHKIKREKPRTRWEVHVERSDKGDWDKWKISQTQHYTRSGSTKLDSPETRCVCCNLLSFYHRS